MHQNELSNIPIKVLKDKDLFTMNKDVFSDELKHVYIEPICKSSS